MSEVVVRMEMPQDCWFCPNGHPDWIYNDNGAAQMVCFCYICNTEEDDRWISETEIVRPSWCPIVCSLPEGHGRLGDLDELLNLMFHYDDYYGAKEAHDLDLIHRDSICYAIENAPTIVPAEAESPSPKPTAPVPIRDVYYVMTECDVKTGTVTYEPRERIEL